jgi:hypothetical protein
MSIANEIQRLQSAKADIKSAIEEKGVTVGDGTVDTYAEKIGEISVGGGVSLPTNIAEISSGTWTQAANVSSNGAIDIEHGLTDAPDLVLVTSDLFGKTIDYNALAQTMYSADSNSLLVVAYAQSAVSTRAAVDRASATVGVVDVDNTKFTIKTASNRQIRAGTTFTWIAMRWAK